MLTRLCRFSHLVSGTTLFVYPCSIITADHVRFIHHGFLKLSIIASCLLLNQEGPKSLPLSHSQRSCTSWRMKRGKKLPKLNIPLTVIDSICSARTDCSILLPCWRAVYLPSFPPSSLCPLLQYGTLFHCQPGQHGSSMGVFVPI